MPQRLANWPEDESSFTIEKMARDGAELDPTSELYVQQSRQGFFSQEQPETPTAKSKDFVQMRPSAEKYNPNGR